jgi:ribosomal protein S18 acetylase RimI-like enzyme
MGIGTGLVQAGLDYLASRGAGRVRLEVRPDNIVALRIYEKLGFKITGQTRDTQKDWLIMVKEMVEDVAT